MPKEPRAENVVENRNRIDVNYIALPKAGDSAHESERKSDHTMCQQPAKASLTDHPQGRHRNVIRKWFHQNGEWTVLRKQYIDASRGKQPSHRRHRIQKAAIRSVKLVALMYAEDPKFALPAAAPLITGAHQLQRGQRSFPIGVPVLGRSR
jgi:hypothetical protein